MSVNTDFKNHSVDSLYSVNYTQSPGTISPVYQEKPDSTNVSESFLKNLRNPEDAEVKTSISSFPLSSSEPHSISQSQTQRMVKQIKGTIEHKHIAPKVDLPSELLQTLSPEELKNLRNSCLQDYKIAMETLEQSVASVAATHPDALEFADQLNQRLMTFLEKYAEILLEDEGKISPTTPKNFKQDKITLKVNELLIEIFSTKREERYNPMTGKTETFDGTIVEGIYNEAGSVGLNPITIRNAIKNGNLREKMYFPYKSTWNFTQEILKNPELVARIDNKLKESQAGWEVNTPMLEDIVHHRKLQPYSYSDYAESTRTDRLRTAIPEAERKQLIKEKNQPIAATRITDLSERERRHAIGELDPSKTKVSEEMKAQYEERSSQQIQWAPGSHWWRPATNVEREQPHDYLTSSAEVGAPAIAGISGTTDQILTMAMYFGMTTKQELEKGRLACLGWMLETQDHTINEIMTSSLGFGLSYTPSPTSYSEIYSEDNLFTHQIQQEQIARNTNLPDYYLSAEWALRKSGLSQ
jgi:hypothetical protein